MDERNWDAPAVYMLHFERKYKQAQHYLGSVRKAKNLSRRLMYHRNGNSGHPLIRCFAKAGIPFVVARIWWNCGIETERRLRKNAGPSSRKCPICKAARNG